MTTPARLDQAAYRRHFYGFHSLSMYGHETKQSAHATGQPTTLIEEDIPPLAERRRAERLAAQCDIYVNSPFYADVVDLFLKGATITAVKRWLDDV